MVKKYDIVHDAQLGELKKIDDSLLESNTAIPVSFLDQEYQMKIMFHSSIKAITDDTRQTYELFQNIIQEETEHIVTAIRGYFFQCYCEEGAFSAGAIFNPDEDVQDYFIPYAIGFHNNGKWGILAQSKYFTSTGVQVEISEGEHRMIHVCQ